jgi:ubiquitin C-terminal hydrolase
LDAGNAKLEKKLIEEFNWPEGKKLIYNCYGVINHYGSMHFGHYTAYAKNNGKWYCYDDSTTTPNNPITFFSTGTPAAPQPDTRPHITRTKSL